MPGAAPRTSSEALGNATLPFGLALADHGLDALRSNIHLAKGLNVLAGELTHPAVAEALGKASVDPYGAWKYGSCVLRDPLRGRLRMRSVLLLSSS
jgi:alanine dehydrogenase